jgi:hypothetical protein
MVNLFSGTFRGIKIVESPSKFPAKMLHYVYVSGQKNSYALHFLNLRSIGNFMSLCDHKLALHLIVLSFLKLTASRRTTNCTLYPKKLYCLLHHEIVSNIFLTCSIFHCVIPSNSSLRWGQKNYIPVGIYFSS